MLSFILNTEEACKKLFFIFDIGWGGFFSLSFMAMFYVKYLQLDYCVLFDFDNFN